MHGPASHPKIIVTGATSSIAHFLLPRLLNAGYEIHAVSRRAHENRNTPGSCLYWYRADISHPRQLPNVRAIALIHLAPLWLLPPLLPVLRKLGIRRMLGFGSTSLFSKARSPHARERQLADRLAEAEEAIHQFCDSSKMNWTIFRPTMVYDYERDKNITRIARFIRRFSFFPLLGAGAGLRQPVHADDLAKACILSLNQPATFNRAYNLSGGETLSYREMVEKIFGALGKTIHFQAVPVWMFRSALHAVALLPGKGDLSPEMANRMNVDLVFDHADAVRDFGYAPRPFSPSPESMRT